MGSASYAAIKIDTFDTVKTHYLPDKNVKHFDVINLTFGALAGQVSMVSTYPLY